MGMGQNKQMNAQKERVNEREKEEANEWVNECKIRRSK